MKKYKRILAALPVTIFWILILILTHMPIPQIVYQARILDKVPHFLAFMLLTWLLWLAIAPGKKINWKRPAVYVAVAILVLYAALDEWSQRFVNRSTDLHDFFANILGITAACLLLTIFSYWHALLWITGVSIFLLENVAGTNPAELAPITYLAFHFTAYGFFELLMLVTLKQKPLFMNIGKLEFFSTVAALIFLFVVITVSRQLNRNIDITNISAAIFGIVTVSICHYLLHKSTSAVQTS